jgi:hypothetical protein
MTLTWQSLGLVVVPARPVGFWALASEFVPGSRLLRIHTLTDTHEVRPAAVSWSPATGIQCGPDGAPSTSVKTTPLQPSQAGEPTPSVKATTVQPSKGDDPPSIVKAGLLCSSAAYGALIGKIGGSTADLPDSTPGVTTPYANKKVFAVGTDSIIALPTAADGGPLFLTMNDKPDEFPKHTGEIQVYLEYYPL